MTKFHQNRKIVKSQNDTVNPRKGMVANDTQYFDLVPDRLDFMGTLRKSAKKSVDLYDFWPKK